MTPAARTEVLVLGFEPGAGFEGQLAGALERAESGGAIRIRESLFVGHDPESGEVVALRVDGGAGALASAVADFRLSPSRRAAAGDDLRDVAQALAPGAAVAAVLIEHVWAGALADAIARTGGRVLADETQAAGEPVDVAERAAAALRG